MDCSRVFQEFLRMQVVNRQERTRSQVMEEQRQPESTNGDWNNQIQPVEIKAAVEVGLDIPEQVHEPHEDEPGGEPHQLARIALKASRQQKQKRHRKMK